MATSHLERLVERPVVHGTADVPAAVTADVGRRDPAGRGDRRARAAAARTSGRAAPGVGGSLRRPGRSGLRTEAAGRAVGPVHRACVCRVAPLSSTSHTTRFVNGWPSRMATRMPCASRWARSASARRRTPRSSSNDALRRSPPRSFCPPSGVAESGAPSRQGPAKSAGAVGLRCGD